MSQKANLAKTAAEAAATVFGGIRAQVTKENVTSAFTSLRSKLDGITPSMALQAVGALSNFIRAMKASGHPEYTAEKVNFHKRVFEEQHDEEEGFSVTGRDGIVIAILAAAEAAIVFIVQKINEHADEVADWADTLSPTAKKLLFAVFEAVPYAATGIFLVITLIVAVRLAHDAAYHTYKAINGGMGKDVASRAIQDLMERGDLECYQQRQIFANTVLVEGRISKNHTHGTSAKVRNAGLNTAREMALLMGKTPYSFQMSGSEQRNAEKNGVEPAGCRTFYMDKDLVGTYKQFNYDTTKHIGVLSDVDYYLNMNQLLGDYPGTMIISTFTPSAAAYSGEYSFRFNEDNQVEYQVTGGGRYGPHHVWDYKGDTITVCSSGLFKRVSVYHIDRKRLDDHHSLILLSLVATFPWPLLPVDWAVAGSPLRRLKPVFGRFVRLDKQTSTGIETSIALLGDWTAVSLTIAQLDAVHAVAATSRISVTANMLNTALSEATPVGIPKTSLKPGDAQKLVAYVRQEIPVNPPMVYPPSAGLTPYYFGKDDYEAPVSLKSIGSPIIHSAYVSANSLASDVAMVQGRMSDFDASLITKDGKPTPLSPDLMRDIEVFATFVVPEWKKHTLHPVGEEAVYDQQDRPQQRRILQEGGTTPWYMKVRNAANSAKAFPNAVYSAARSLAEFKKNEPNQKPSAPRPIAQFDSQTKLNFSRFVMAFAEFILNDQEWYAFGKTPDVIAELIAKKAKDARTINCSDANRYDGHVEYRMQALERIIYLRAFHPDHHAEVQELMDSIIGLIGYTQFSIVFNNFYKRASGGSNTASGNSLGTAFIDFRAARKTMRNGRYMSPEEAWQCLIMVGGDDSINRNIDPKAIIAAAKEMGQDYDVETYTPGQPGVNFLNRYFGPGLWTGDENSICNVPRALQKIFIQATSVDKKMELPRFLERMAGYFRSDLHTPLLGDLVRAVKQRYAADKDWSGAVKFDRYTTTWAGQFAADCNFPNEVGDWAQDLTDQWLPDFDRALFAKWCANVAAGIEPDAFHAPLCVPEVRSAKAEQVKLTMAIGDDKVVFGLDNDRRIPPKPLDRGDDDDNDYDDKFKPSEELKKAMDMPNLHMTAQQYNEEYWLTRAKAEKAEHFRAKAQIAKSTKDYEDHIKWLDTVKCYNCDKVGHIASMCEAPLRRKHVEVNLFDPNTWTPPSRTGAKCKNMGDAQYAQHLVEWRRKMERAAMHAATERSKKRPAWERLPDDTKSYASDEAIDYRKFDGGDNRSQEEIGKLQSGSNEGDGPWESEPMEVDQLANLWSPQTLAEHVENMLMRNGLSDVQIEVIRAVLNVWNRAPVNGESTLYNYPDAEFAIITAFEETSADDGVDPCDSVMQFLNQFTGLAQSHPSVLRSMLARQGLPSHFGAIWDALTFFTQAACDEPEEFVALFDHMEDVFFSSDCQEAVSAHARMVVQLWRLDHFDGGDNTGQMEIGDLGAGNSNGDGPKADVVCIYATIGRLFGIYRLQEMYDWSDAKDDLFAIEQFILTTSLHERKRLATELCFGPQNAIVLATIDLCGYGQQEQIGMLGTGNSKGDGPLFNGSRPSSDFKVLMDKMTIAELKEHVKLAQRTLAEKEREASEQVTTLLVPAVPFADWRSAYAFYEALPDKSRWNIEFGSNQFWVKRSQNMSQSQIGMTCGGNSKGDGPPKPGAKKITCFNCGKEGHIAVACKRAPNATAMNKRLTKIVQDELRPIKAHIRQDYINPKVLKAPVAKQPKKPVAQASSVVKRDAAKLRHKIGEVLHAGSPSLSGKHHDGRVTYGGHVRTKHGDAHVYHVESRLDIVQVDGTTMAGTTLVKARVHPSTAGPRADILTSPDTKYLFTSLQLAMDMECALIDNDTAGAIMMGYSTNPDASVPFGVAGSKFMSTWENNHLPVPLRRGSHAILDCDLSLATQVPLFISRKDDDTWDTQGVILVVASTNLNADNEADFNIGELYVKSTIHSYTVSTESDDIDGSMVVGFGADLNFSSLPVFGDWGSLTDWWGAKDLIFFPDFTKTSVSFVFVQEGEYLISLIVKVKTVSEAVTAAPYLLYYGSDDRKPAEVMYPHKATDIATGKNISFYAAQQNISITGEDLSSQGRLFEVPDSTPQNVAANYRLVNFLLSVRVDAASPFALFAPTTAATYCDAYLQISQLSSVPAWGQLNNSRSTPNVVLGSDGLAGLRPDLEMEVRDVLNEGCELTDADKLKMCAWLTANGAKYPGESNVLIDKLGLPVPKFASTTMIAPALVAVATWAITTFGPMLAEKACSYIADKIDGGKRHPTKEKTSTRKPRKEKRRDDDDDDLVVLATRP